MFSSLPLIKRVVCPRISVSVLATAFVFSNCLGQQKTLPANDFAHQYRVFNRIGSAETGDTILHLNEAAGAGGAWLTGREFTSGTIEFDIRGKDAFQQSFVGIAFHGLNDTTYEAIYFRPFNFRSTDPVRKGHAVQYIANPLYDWPKLRAEYPGKYEQPVSPVPDPNGWFHVRVEVSPKKISVYVDHHAAPSLIVAPLVQSGGKQIGFWVGNGSGGDWKNLVITR